MPNGDGNGYNSNYVVPIGAPWSRFKRVTSTAGSSRLCIIDNSQNSTISVDDFAAQYNLADIDQIGNPLDPQVLVQNGSQYGIRSIGGTGGVSVQVSPQNGLEVSQAFENIGSGVALNADLEADVIQWLTLVGGQDIQISSNPSTGIIEFDYTGGGGTPSNAFRKDVFSLADFPSPSGGIIDLEEDVTYVIYGVVDVSPNRFRINHGGTSLILGTSLAASQLVTDATGAMFEVTDSSFIFNQCFAICTTPGALFTSASDITGTKFFSLRSFGIAADGFGTVDNFGSFFYRIGDITLISSGIILTGVFDTGVFELTQTKQVSPFAQLDITNAQFNIFNMAQDGWNTVVGGVGIDGQGANNILPGGSGLITGSVFLGSGTGVTNINPNDTGWRSKSNSGFPDSRTVGFAYIDTPASTNVLNGTYVPIDGTYAANANTARAMVTADGRIIMQNLVEVDGAAVTVNGSVTRDTGGGGGENYSIRVEKDVGGVGVWAPVPQGETQVTIEGNDTVNFSISTIDLFNNLDEYRVTIAGIGTGDNVTVETEQFIIRE